MEIQEIPQQPRDDSEALFELVHAMAEVLKNNAQRYWLSPHDAEEATDNAYRSMTTLIKGTDGISFKLTGDELLVNDVPVPCDSTPVDFLVEHLVERGLADFRFEEEMTLDDFRRFLDFVNADPIGTEQDGGCTAAARERGIGHLTVRRVVFKEVAEDEVVVQKERVREEDAGETVDNQALAGVVAFLRGAPTEPDAVIDDKVRQVASDPEKLVDLIMHSVDIRGQSASLEGAETLADVVVGSLRRTFHVLKQHPTTKSQRGRKSLSRTLVLLEKEMLDAIRDVSDTTDLQAARDLSDAIEDMSDELEVDALADDYVRKRRAIEQSERRLIRYMRAKGIEHAGEGYLRTRLEEDGLNGEWQELVVKSRDPSLDKAVPEAAGGLLALGQLARLLTQMERIVTQTREKSQSEVARELDETVSTVRHAVKGAVEGTHEKIRELARGIEDEERAESDRKAGRKPQPHRQTMSRKRMLEVLAEIVQELCQPLSVINCSLQMIMSGRLGTVTEPQVSMLKLADESAERITMLTDNLRKISGEPETLEPDLDMTRSFYHKS